SRLSRLGPPGEFPCHAFPNSPPWPNNRKHPNIRCAEFYLSVEHPKYFPHVIHWLSVAAFQGRRNGVGNPPLKFRVIIPTMQRVGWQRWYVSAHITKSYMSAGFSDFRQISRPKYFG